MSPIDDDSSGAPPTPATRAQARHRRQNNTFLGLAGAVMLVGFAALGNWEGWWTIGSRAEAAIVACPTQAVIDPALTRVNVYNGTNRQGLASAVAKEMQTRTFKVIKIGTEEQKKPITVVAVIRYGQPGLSTAKTVALEFPAKVKLVDDGRDSRTVDVVLGEQYKQMVDRKKAAAAIKPKPEPANCVPVTTPAATPEPSAS
jgi:hypothetical protein